jgi:hypothetical protein
MNLSPISIVCPEMSPGSVLYTITTVWWGGGGGRGGGKGVQHATCDWGCVRRPRRPEQALLRPMPLNAAPPNTHTHLRPGRGSARNGNVARTKDKRSGSGLGRACGRQLSLLNKVLPGLLDRAGVGIGGGNTRH